MVQGLWTENWTAFERNRRSSSGFGDFAWTRPMVQFMVHQKWSKNRTGLDFGTTSLHTESSQLLDFYTYLTWSTTILAVETRSTLGKRHGNALRPYAVRSYLTRSFEVTSMVSDLWSRSVIARLGQTPAKHSNMTLNILFLAFFYYFIV